MNLEGLIVGSAILRNGKLKTITGTDPAADGSEIVETVPAGKAWHLLGVTFTFISDGTAGTRVVRLIIDNGTSTMWEIHPTQTQAATLTAIYSYLAGGGSSGGATTVAGGSLVTVGLPTLCVIPAAGRIQTSTVAKQATDNYSAPLLTVVEYEA